MLNKQAGFDSEPIANMPASSIAPFQDNARSQSPEASAGGLAEGGSASFWVQMRFLLTKQFKLKMRNKLLTVAEILMPVYIILFLLLIRRLNVIPYEVIHTSAAEAAPRHSIFLAPPEPLFMKSLSDSEKIMQMDTIRKYKYDTDPIRFGVAPKGGLLASKIADALCLMDRDRYVKTKINATFGDGVPCFGVKMFDQGSELYASKGRFDNIPSGLDFGIIVNEANFNFTLVHHEFALLNSTVGEEQESAAAKNNLIGLQCMITAVISSYGQASLFDGAVIPPMTTMPFGMLKVGDTQMLTPYLREFPTSERTVIVNFLKYIFAVQFIQVLVLNYIGPMIRMAQEKEKGIKRALLMKGMSPGAYWATWLISESTTILVSTCIAVGMLYACQHFLYTDVGWVFLGFLLFGIAYCCLGFLLSFLAEKAYTLSMFAALFNLLTIVAFLLVQLLMINPGNVSRSGILFLFLIAPVPFGHIMYEMISTELLGRGWTPDMSEYGKLAYGFLVIDIVVYMTLCIIIENFMDVFREVAKKKEERNLADMALATNGGGGIVVRGLKKKFVVMEKNEWGIAKKKVVQAVNGLDLTVADRTIFCLLGHNGAGKTTTMSLITGALHPDEGWAMVGGFDVVKQRSQLRKSLGVCPQFDVLYSELTCWEHMHLYGGMQGLTPDECDKEAHRLLGELDLLVKKDQKSSNMSGGQQRRLSLAVSLIGNPKVVLLDEPTTGLDPANRRRVWKVLQQQKRTSTIIMTTHSMEEADLLADCIGVMSKGQIQAVGSTLERKKRFGTGYLLHILKSTGFKEEAVLKAVHSAITGVTVSSNVSGEMALSLPLGQEDHFPILFDEFDEKKDFFGLQTYSLSMSTLEEVFLRLAEHENDTQNVGVPLVDTATNPVDGTESSSEPPGSQGDHQCASDLPSISVSIPVNGGGGAGTGGGDVWAELENFECKKSTIRQTKAVLVSTFTAARRNPITFMLLVWNPVWMSVIVSLVFPLIKAKPPSSVAMTPALLDNTTLLVGIQPLPGMAGPVSDSVVARSLSILGSNFKSRTVLFQDDAALNRAMLSSTAGNSSASVSVLFEVDPLNGSGSVTFGYNKMTMRSARVLIAQALNATAYLAKPDAFPNGIGCSYLFWRSPLYSNAISAGGLSLIVCTAFNVLAILYAMDMVRLRVARVKEMFLLSGLPRLTFWLAHGLGHFALFCIAFGISFIVLRTVGGMDGVVNNNFLGYALLYLFFAPAIILLGYCLSFLFEKEETAQVMTDQIVNLTVFIPWIIMVFVTESKKQSAELGLSLIPGWALYRGHSILETAALNEAPFSAADVFNWDKELAQCLMMLSIDIFYLSVLLWLLDTGLLKKLFARSLGSHFLPVEVEAKLQEEEEALAKRLPPIRRDTSGHEQTVAVVANNLVKTYCPSNAPPTWACRGVSLQVEKGTVYGLLGPNGAGKSTMMSMLTGIETCDSGDGFINGKSITWDLETCRSFIGLCPQFDALIDNLTAREHLVMLAEIRGVPSHLVPRVVERAIVDMALSEKAGAVCKTYSGGNKRKLSVAMSIVANPKVSFLDEPSTGMDPETRRQMWAFISRIAQSRAVILTTHSMEEADALCNRIGIMIHGNLRAEGTSQELKSNYGSGYLIQVRFDDKVDLEKSSLALTALLQQLSPGLKLEDSSTRAFRYEVPQSDVNIGPLFKTMIENKVSLGIEDFSVSQSTLEDVFLYFARQQSEEK